MDFTDQAFLNLVIAACGTLLTALYSSARKKMEDMQHEIVQNRDEISRLRTSVAGEYATREELQDALKEMTASMDRHSNRIDTYFQRIYDKIDAKADK